VLYAVGHRSPHEASSSPLASDSSPRAPSQLSPAAGSPQWFAHPPSPSSPSHLASATGELSPVHATALQQQFQQFSMASIHCILLIPVLTWGLLNRRDPFPGYQTWLLFLPCDTTMHAVLALYIYIYMRSWCVCPSDTSRCSTKTAKPSIMRTVPYDRPRTLVF